MKAVEKLLDRIMEAILIVSTFTVFSITLAQVLSRFVFRMPIPWSQDIIRLAFVYVVFVGSAYCVKYKMHLNVDVFIDLLHGNFYRAAKILINLIVLTFMAFLMFYGLKFTMGGTRQMAPYLSIPMAVYYFSIPLSMAYSCYYLICEIIEQIKSKESKQEG